MAVAFTNLSWWLWSGKDQDTRKSNTSLNARTDADLWETDTLKFPMVQGAKAASSSSSRRVRRKWHSREERKIDKEYDIVIVPSDGCCFSGSESDDSDYSIGWLEPHGPSFQSDDEMDNSFAVLVPCYGRAQDQVHDEGSKNEVFGTIFSVQDGFSDVMVMNYDAWTLQNLSCPRVGHVSDTDTLQTLVGHVSDTPNFKRTLHIGWALRGHTLDTPRRR